MLSLPLLLVHLIILRKNTIKVGKQLLRCPCYIGFAMRMVLYILCLSMPPWCPVSFLLLLVDIQMVVGLLFFRSSVRSVLYLEASLAK